MRSAVKSHRATDSRASLQLFTCTVGYFSQRRHVALPHPGRVLTFRKRARWPRGEDERLRARARGADRGEQATDARDGDHDVIREARARDGDAGADAGARDDPHFDPTLAGGNIPSTLFCLVASSRGFARRIAIASVAEPRYLLVRAQRASSRRVASFRASPRALPDDR